MRKKIYAGNWKMHKTVPEALKLVEELKVGLSDLDFDNVEVVLCPTYTALYSVGEAIKGTNLQLGAQDLFWEEEGAYTGEISPLMLKDLGCRYVIIGHSERRGYFGETDEDVNKKAKSALKHGIMPIICVGETLSQREAGLTEGLVRDQVSNALDGIDAADVPKVVIAYEPIWAIGTGKSSTADDANRVIGIIREKIASIYGSAVADQVRIQYGGSVKPENIGDFMSQPEIDGALVGGASLKAEQFIPIAKA